MNDRALKAIAAIVSVFESVGAQAYLGEEVTMVQHQLQAAELAAAVGSPDEVVVAALLHDIGHMVGHDLGEVQAEEAFDAGRDDRHDMSGANWLGRWFGPEVTEPVRLHVAAKRFLVSTEADYPAKLSAASVYTLSLQGGPMNLVEIEQFRANPHHLAAVAVRRFDEDAKDGSHHPPPIDSYRPLLLRALQR